MNKIVEQKYEWPATYGKIDENSHELFDEIILYLLDEFQLVDCWYTSQPRQVVSFYPENIHHWP